MLKPSREIRHFHLFCGIGGGAIGFNKASARVGNLSARFRCLGGIDCEPAAIRDFDRHVDVPGTVMDLFDADQYRDFHGSEPPSGWREATPEDIRRAAGYERPHIVFTSAPCKGFSGLLSQKRSTTAKYQALNRLTLRGVWLTLEAWPDDPPEFILFENVPRIATRGRYLLDQITKLLRLYGYAVAETAHDCGELAGLSQSRKRFLLVARHAETVPPFLYEPVKRRSQVGQGRFAVADPRGVNAHSGILGVKGWSETSGTVTGNGRPMSGPFAVADPRTPGKSDYGQYSVRPWEATMGAVRGQAAPGGGPNAIADPRLPDSKTRQYNFYRIVEWSRHANTITGAAHVSGGAPCVADPRPGLDRGPGDHYLTGGHYGVVAYDEPCGAVSAAACHDNGRWSVADPELPGPGDNVACVIRALDGTWHRPFTTYELAALQGFIDPDAEFVLDGESHQSWRERIGNAVPPPAAQAIAGVMGQTLLLAWSGETFAMSATPIWVQPFIAGMMAGDVRG